MRSLFLFAAIAVMSGCTVTEPTPENDCDPSGIEASQSEANALALLSMANLVAGGSQYSGLSAHASNSDQQAEIIKLKVELCKQKLDQSR